jgi:hypothetical protein
MTTRAGMPRFSFSHHWRSHAKNNRPDLLAALRSHCQAGAPPLSAFHPAHFPSGATLYHFTSRFHLPLIEDAGAITHGDVELSPTEGFNAPWLTTNPERAAQGWAAMPPDFQFQGLHLADKSEVRLAVHIPAPFLTWLVSSGALHHHFRIDEDFYHLLTTVPQGGNPPAEWHAFLHPNGIPLAWVTEIHDESTRED